MRDKVLDRISNVEELPTLSKVATEVMEIVNSEDYSVRDLKKAIEKDPGLVAKILKVANSFLFNPYGREITSVDRAIMQIGVKNLVPVVIGLTVVKLSEKAGSHFDKELFWKHCYTCGHVAKRLAKRFGLPESEAFTAGILHDVGKLVLYTLFPDEYNRALELSEKENLISVEAENRVFGIDHTEVGEVVLKHWKLPSVIWETVRFHHCPEKAKEHRKMASLIHLADVLSRATGAYYNRDSLGISITEDPGWRALTSELEQEPEELILPVFDDAEDAAQLAKIAWEQT